MEQITYTKTYSDTAENLLFAATFYNYKTEIFEIGSDGKLTGNKIPNPQSPIDFLNALAKSRIDPIVEAMITAPLKAYLADQAKAQADEIVKAKVLANLQ